MIVALNVVKSSHHTIFVEIPTMRVVSEIGDKVHRYNTFIFCSFGAGVLKLSLLTDAFFFFVTDLMLNKTYFQIAEIEQ